MVVLQLWPTAIGLSFSLARYVKSKHVRRIKVRPFTRVERDPLRATEAGA